jgi:hypothetical protein
MLTSLLVVLIPMAFEFNAPGDLGSAMLAGVGMPRSENAVFRNPSLLCLLPSSSIGLAATRPFSLPDVGFARLKVALRGPALGARLSLLSAKGYQELTGSISKGVRASDHVAFGASLNVYALTITGEYSEVMPGLSAGVAYSVPGLCLGAAIHDFNRPSLGGGDVMPARLMLGVGVTPNPSLCFGADGQYDNALQLRFGASFILNPALTLAIGMGTNPLRYAAGLQASLKGLGFNYTYSFHPRLKETHELGLSCSF